MTDPLDRLLLERGKPHLPEDGYERKSPKSPAYNCFAWAAGDDQHWWEPSDPDIDPHAGPTYWPPGAPNTNALDSYVQVFVSLGYTECVTADLEAGFEKIALYADEEGEPTHAAKQLESGMWSSKIGNLEDIEHTTLRALEGRAYGNVVRLMKRPRP